MDFLEKFHACPIRGFNHIISKFYVGEILSFGEIPCLILIWWVHRMTSSIFRQTFLTMKKNGFLMVVLVQLFTTTLNTTYLFISLYNEGEGVGPHNIIWLLNWITLTAWLVSLDPISCDFYVFSSHLMHILDGCNEKWIGFGQ